MDRDELDKSFNVFELTGDMTKDMETVTRMLSGLTRAQPSTTSLQSTGRNLTVRERKHLPNAEIERRNMQAASRHGGPCPWMGFKSLDPRFASAAKPPMCSEKCIHCSEQYLPKEAKILYPIRPIELHDDKTAKAEIQRLLYTIEANRAEMRKFINTWGDVIIKRWSRRDSTKRQKLVLQASPDIYPKEHLHPEYTYELEDAFKRMEKTGKTEKLPMMPHLETSYAPYLNLVSVSENRLNLIALMHYRTYNHPSEWMRFDCQQMRQSFHGCALETAYNPHAVVAYGQDFGKLVPWEKDAAHKWDTIGYAAARLALVAQCKITDFLLKMMNVILKNDLSDSIKGRGMWDELARGGFKEADPDGTVWEYTESPFAAPPRFNATQLVELFTARMEAAQNELWLLQSEPIHLRNMFERFDRSTRYHDFNQQKRQQALIQMTLGSVTRVKTWSWALEESMLLAAWTDKFGDITKPGVALPIDYEIVLARFEHRLEEIYVKQADELGLLCGSLSTFENYFEASTTWPEPSFRIVAESSDSFRKDKLFWNIHELRQWLHYNSNSRSFHFAHIDKIIARSPEEKTRVDQLLLDHLSDMAATDQALSAIKYHRSRRTIDSIDLSATSSNEDPEADETETFVRAVTAEKGGNNALWKKLKKFADLPKPSDPPTRESVTHLVALQTGLQEYWEEVRSVKTALMKGIKMPSNFIFAYMFSISLGLTDAAEAGWEEDRKELLRLVELRENPVDPVSQSSIDETPIEPQQAKLETAVDAPKATKKSCPKPQPTSSKIETTEDQATDSTKLSLTDDTTRIPVKPETLKFFTRMFSSPLAALGMTPWKDLVSALADAGFSATCQGGSAVTFRHPSSDLGSIVFHRPHPDSKIAPKILRRLGKRLNETFGWDEDTFIVRSR